MASEEFIVEDHAGMELKKMLDSAGKAADVIKGMSNEYRLLILCHLSQGEHSVGQLQTILNMKQSVLSQHLGILREKKLVVTRREAQTVFYRIGLKEVEAIIALLYELFCEDDKR